MAEVDGHCSSRKYKDKSEWIVNTDMYPPIVDKDVFNKVQKMMTARAVGNRSPNTVYLLKGKVFCGLCGKPYVGNRRISGKGQISFYYSCNRPKALGRCQNRSVKKDVLEGFVLTRLADYVFNDRMIPNIVDSYNKYLRERNGSELHKLDVLRNDLRSINSKISNIAELLIENKSKALFSKLEEYERKAEIIKAEIKEIEDNCSVMSVIEDELRRQFAAIRQRMRNGEAANIRHLIEQFVHRVNVYPEKIEVIFNFYPDKVKYIPRTEKDNSIEGEERSKECPSLFVPECVVVDTEK